MWCPYKVGYVSCGRFYYYAPFGVAMYGQYEKGGQSVNRFLTSSRTILRRFFAYAYGMVYRNTQHGSYP